MNAPKVSAGKQVSKSRRRWLQLSLRTIFIAFLLVAFLSAYFGRSTVGYYHDRKVADRIEALGGTCEWMEFSPSFGSTADNVLVSLGAKPLIDRTLGRVNDRLVAISLAGRNVAIEDVELLVACEKLKSLSLTNVGLSNELVASIALIEPLESLDVSGNLAITDASFDSLSGIPNLDLTGTSVSYAAHKKLTKRRNPNPLQGGLNLSPLKRRAMRELDKYANAYSIAMLQMPEPSNRLDEALHLLAPSIAMNEAPWEPIVLRDAEHYGYSTDELMRWWSESFIYAGTQGPGLVGDKHCLAHSELVVDASQLTSARQQILKHGARPGRLVVYLDVVDRETIRRVVQLSANTLVLCGQLDAQACSQLVTSLPDSPMTERLVFLDAEISNETAQDLMKIESLRHVALPCASISREAIQTWNDDRYFPLETLVLPETLWANKSDLIAKRIALKVEFGVPVLRER